MSQGFFQQTLIDPQEATSFSIPGYGQFSYCRSPQGYFQLLLDHVLPNISRVYVYIDDIVICVRSHEENLERLKAVFARFRQHNLKVKPSKCHIGTGAITYLGYEISSKGPGKAKMEIIKNWPQPNTTKDIQAFLGLTSFFRRTCLLYTSPSPRDS